MDLQSTDAETHHLHLRESYTSRVSRTLQGSCKMNVRIVPGNGLFRIEASVPKIGHVKIILK